jgi:hypothetical protein
MQSWFKTVISTAAPSSEWPWWAISAQTAIAAHVGYFWSMNAAFRWLVLGIAANLLATLACVVFLPDKRGQVHFKQDVAVKSLMIWLVWMLSKEPMLQVDIAGQSVSIAAVLAAYFLTAEWIGFLQRAGDLGMKFPKWVGDALQRANDSINNADVGGKVIGAMTSFTQRSDGSTETISNTSTIVTTKPEAPSA